MVTKSLTSLKTTSVLYEESESTGGGWKKNNTENTKKLNLASKIAIYQLKATAMSIGGSSSLQLVSQVQAQMEHPAILGFDFSSIFVVVVCQQSHVVL